MKPIFEEILTCFRHDMPAVMAGTDPYSVYELTPSRLTMKELAQEIAHAADLTVRRMMTPPNGVTKGRRASGATVARRQFFVRAKDELGKSLGQVARFCEPYRKLTPQYISRQAAWGRRAMYPKRQAQRAD